MREEPVHLAMYFLSNNHCPTIKCMLGSKSQLHLDSGWIAQLRWAKVKDDGKRKKNYSKKDLEQLKRLLWNNMDPEKEPLAWKRKSCLCFGLSGIRGQKIWRASCFMWQPKFFQEQKNTVKAGAASPTTKQSWEHSDMTRLLGLPLDLTGESPSWYLSDEGIQAIKHLVLGFLPPTVMAGNYHVGLKGKCDWKRNFNNAQLTLSRS